MSLLFALRFDLRNPDFSDTTPAERYQAALAMAEWADGLGCVSIVLSEHHGSPDGYLPSPIPMAAAIAARTNHVRIGLAALIAPFYDPLRLAEDLIVVDQLSEGRLDVILAGGYVREEFAMFDVPMRERPERVTETVQVLRGAFGGQPFEYRGRTVQITPGPYQPNGPAVILGGGSEPAARRAARIGDGFLPTTAASWEYYRDEVQRQGRPDPGPSPIGDQRLVALAHDADAGWAQMEPYFLHECNSYGEWQAQDDVDSPYRTVADGAELRATRQYDVLTPEQYIVELQGAPVPFVLLHPLCGGMPLDLAWSSLHHFEHDVLPAFD